MSPDNPIPALDRIPETDHAASQRLFQLGCGGLIVLVGLFLVRSGGDADAKTLTGLAILVLSFVPALQWARLGRGWFPAFELFCMSAAAFYAFPLLIVHPELKTYPEGVVTESGLLVAAYLISAIFGFSVSQRSPRAPHWATASLLPEFAYRYVPAGVILNTIYIFIDSHTNLIPFDMAGTLRALFFGLGTLSTFILAKLAGMGELAPATRTMFLVNLTLQIVLLFSHLYLITGISLLTLALIAYASARRKIPWLLLAVLLPLVTVLHSGKSQMRAIYWQNGQYIPGLLEAPAFFIEWIGYGLEGKEVDEKKPNKVSIFERASLIQMLCLVVDRVPAAKPYLTGESYVDIPVQIIPRFVWRDKPSSLLANVRLAVYFGLVDPNNAMQVSIAFGMLSEAYVNFGWLGVGFLGFLFGWAFRRISVLSLGAPQLSTLGIFMILLTAWSFQAELVLATWLTSLLQASMVCIGIPLIYRQFVTR